MRRSRAAAGVAALLSLVVIGFGIASENDGTGGSPHLTVKPAHLLTACASSDCGSYSLTFGWSGVTVNGFVSYYVFCSQSGSPCGSNPTTQVATVASSPYLLTGADCGQTYTLGVQAHGSSTDSVVYNTTYSTPACQVAGSPFPLARSANNRYLVDSQGQPWLMVGDSPWGPIGSTDRSHWDTYLADRKAHGFNTVLVSTLCDAYILCSRTDGRALDGTAPFTSGSGIGTWDLSTGNAAYWTQVHAMVADAQAQGIAVLLDPIDTGGCNTSQSWWPAITNNGNGTVSTTDKDYLYGQFLGNTFKDLGNVIWLSGNDFGCYTTAASDANVLTIANGIKNTDPTAIQTLELSYNFSHSLEDTTHTWTGILGLDGVYSYMPQYNETAQAYAEATTTPTFFQEGDYEAQGAFGKGGSVRDVRMQEWWSATSGATAGQVYGGPCFEFTNATNLASCDSPAAPGVDQLGYLTGLLQSFAWQTLQPDTGHTLLYCGSSGNLCPASPPANGCPSDGSLSFAQYDTTDCVTDSKTSDGTNAIAYLPQGGSVTVNLAQMTGAVTARWMDPTRGTFVSAGTGLTGTQTFTRSTPNADNQPDWVLVLQASGSASPSLTVSAPGSASTGSAIAPSSIGGILASGAAPTGTMTFKVFGPQTSAPTTCTSGGTVVGTATVAGNGTYNPSAGYTPPSDGNYWWYVTYSGDSANSPAVSTCGSGMTETVSSTGGGGQAATYYVSQNGGSMSCGGSTVTTQAISFLTTSSNWGTGANQIGPGDTVGLCGTITTAWAAQASGTAGNPITIYWEPGATMSNATWGGSAAISGTVSYVVFDGGNNAGSAPGGASIQATQMGSQLSGAGGHDQGFYITCNHCTFKNLTIANIYQHTLSSDQANNENTGNNAIYLYHSADVTVANNVIHDCGWCIIDDQSNQAGPIYVYGNDFYRMDHGFSPTTGFGGGNLGPIYFYDNHIHDMGNWDTDGGGFHHDGIHCYTAAGGLVASHYVGFFIFDNRWDGTIGGAATAWIFIEGGLGGSGNTPCDDASSPLYIFNNVFTSTDYISTNPYLTDSGGNTWLYNNIFIGAHNNDSNRAKCYGYGGATSGGQLTAINDAVGTCYHFLSIDNHADYASGSPDYSVYSNAGSEGWLCVGNYHPYNSSGFSAWKTCAGGGADSHSCNIDDAGYSGTGSCTGNPTTMKLNADLSPQSGSALLGAGANLTSTCSGMPFASTAIPLYPGGVGSALCTTYTGPPAGGTAGSTTTGSARPSSGSWNIGPN